MSSDDLVLEAAVAGRLLMSLTGTLSRVLGLFADEEYGVRITWNPANMFESSDADSGRVRPVGAQFERFLGVILQLKKREEGIFAWALREQLPESTRTALWDPAPMRAAARLLVSVSKIDASLDELVHFHALYEALGRRYAEWEGVLPKIRVLKRRVADLVEHVDAYIGTLARGRQPRVGFIASA